MGGYTVLHERLKNGVNMTVDDVRAIVAANPGCAKQVYRNSEGRARSAIDYALNEGKNSAANRVAIAEYLIDDCGAPVAPEFNSGKPLFCFYNYGFIRWLWARKCLYGGIDFTARTPDEGRNVLHMLAVQGDLDMFITISEKYPELIVEPDNEGKSVLHLAAIADKQGIIKYILENLQQVDPNGKDNYERTPLQLAKNCHSNLAEYELSTSYRVKKDIPVVPPAAACTPKPTAASTTNKCAAPKSAEEAKKQVIAAIRGNSIDEFYSELASFKASCGDLNCEVEGGKTILHLLVEKGNTRRIEHLLKKYSYSVNINCVSKNEGDTPLISFAKNCKNKDDLKRLGSEDYACKVIDLLIQYGADPTITNMEGKNALDYCPKKFTKIRNKLISCGCPIPAPVCKESHNPIKALVKKILS